MWPVPSPKCYHVLNWFFLQKPSFLEFIWIFSSRNHLKINISHILNPNLTQKIPLNSAHQVLSNNTKDTFQLLWNFQLQFNLTFSENIIQYSRTFASHVQMSCNQADELFLIKSFPKRPRTQSEASWFGWSHKYKTKQNKQTTFLLHREMLSLSDECMICKVCIS